MMQRSKLSAMVVAMIAGQAAAQCGLTSLFASDASSTDKFGSSIAAGLVAGLPVAGIGAAFDDNGSGVDAGSVYLFQRANNVWSQTHRLDAPVASAGARFGTSVDVSDAWIASGGPLRNNMGAACIYGRFGGLYGQEELILGDQIGAEFGASVGVTTMDGGWAIVGAPKHDFHSQPDAGAIFIYRRTGPGTWAEMYHQWGADFSGSLGDNLGRSVTMSKDSQWAAAGAPYKELFGQPANHGVVHTFTRSNNDMFHEATVAPAFKQANANFGYSVSISDDWMAVGAPGQTVAGLANAGAVYLYRNYGGDGWLQWTMISAADPTAGARFGSSVALDGLTVTIGSEGRGKSYVFQYGWGGFQTRFETTDPDSADNFAKGGVAVIGDEVLIADSLDDANGLTDQGAAYAWHLGGGGQSDTLAGALLIQSGTEGMQRSGCTALATPSGWAVSSCGGGGTGADVWYEWTPMCSGNVIIDTFGSAYDTVLSVHDGLPTQGDTHQVACNDDGFPSPERDSLVTFNYTSGTTYYIRVSGYNGAEGAYVLRMVTTVGASNDNCAQAMLVTAGSYVSANCGATDSVLNLPTPCSGATLHKDLWYRYVAPATGKVTFSMCATNQDPVMAVYAGMCPGNGAVPLMCNDDACPAGLGSSLTLDVTAGSTYTLRVGSLFEEYAGTSTLVIGDVITCDGDVNCDNALDGFDVEIQEKAVGGDMSDYCQADPDFNHDFALDGFDVEAVEVVVGGGACP